MKNTIENKSRFFTQYYGQKEWGRDIYNIDNLYEVDLSESYGWLVLKPLSSITDEDAIEVANILGIDRAMEHHGRLFVDRIMGKRAGNSQDNCYLTYTSLWCCDYLRSKGYVIPYMGLSVEQLIEYGWVKLKTSIHETTD